MLANRRRRLVRLGLWSTAVTMSSPSTANVIATRCGRPAASAVASRATRADASSARASSASTTGLAGGAVLLDHGRQVVEARLGLRTGDRRHEKDVAAHADALVARHLGRLRRCRVEADLRRL